MSQMTKTRLSWSPSMGFTTSFSDLTPVEFDVSYGAQLDQLKIDWEFVHDVLDPQYNIEDLIEGLDFY